MDYIAYGDVFPEQNIYAAMPSSNIQAAFDMFVDYAYENTFEEDQALLSLPGVETYNDFILPEQTTAITYLWIASDLPLDSCVRGH